MAVSLQHFSETNNNSKALVLSETLDDATDKFLDTKKSPSRKVNELDNRGSHFYLAMYWAQALANQTKDTELQTAFSDIAKELEANETQITKELIAVQGKPMDIGGYYETNDALTTSAMRPSETFNAILNKIV